MKKKNLTTQNAELRQQLESLRGDIATLLREKADYRSLNRRFARTTEALFDLTELHLSVMKRVKVDYSHNLIDNNRDTHPLFSRQDLVKNEK